MNIDQQIDVLRTQFNVLDIINCDNYLPASADLYFHINTLHRETFESNQRIVFLITKDYYKNELSCGIMLQSIQTMINDIDISNYFICIVTPNTKIKTEYQWALDTISTDKISMHVYECDGEYKRGEYLRSGQNWNDIVTFRQEMLAKRPDIDFYISATTSILNALHLPDFHRSWVDQGLIAPEDFNIQMLFEPDYLRVDCAPEYLKNLIREKYRKHLEWLRPRDTVGRAVYGFESILNYIDNNAEFDAIKFWNNIKPLDEYYGQDLVATFPELVNLPVN